MFLSLARSLKFQNFCNKIEDIRRLLRVILAEFRWPEGSPSGAPYSYRKEKEAYDMSGFSYGYHGWQY